MGRPWRIGYISAPQDLPPEGPLRVGRYSHTYTRSGESLAFGPAQGNTGLVGAGLDKKGGLAVFKRNQVLAGKIRNAGN